MASRLEIRVEPEEKSAYDVAAKQAGLERSDWIRATLNAAAEKAKSALTNGEQGNRTRPAKTGS